MTSNFNDAAINSVFDKVVSYALASGRFDQVNQHEPKNAPGNGVYCSVWVQTITPYKRSGLAATTGVLLLNSRIYTSFTQQPFDMIDPNITSAVCDLMGALSGDFDFGQIANVQMVDLLGASGMKMQAQAGYVEIDKHVYRVMTLAIPIIINDMFAQAA
jgi:hypothetical protein